MLPHGRSLVEELKGKPFAIVGINSDPMEKLKELVKDGTTTWRNFANKQKNGRKISDEWGVRSWPTLYILDHKGVIRHKNILGDDLNRELQALLAEAGHEYDLAGIE